MDEQKSWCGKVEGREHILVFKEDGHPPHCQPMRAWARELMESDPKPLPNRTRALEEDWECFHWEQCTRCRKKTRIQIFRDECPTAKPGAVIIADPA